MNDKMKKPTVIAIAAAVVSGLGGGAGGHLTATNSMENTVIVLQEQIKTQDTRIAVLESAKPLVLAEKVENLSNTVTDLKDEIKENNKLLRDFILSERSSSN